MNNNKPEVLFLTLNSLSFVARSVKKLLEDADIQTDELEFSMDGLKQHEELAPVVLGEAELLLSDDGIRVYLYDKCIENDVQVILIGEHGQIESVMDVTSKALISEKFSRPVNVKDVAKKIEQILDIVRKKGFRKKVLIVDDSPTFLRTAAEWFGDEYNVSVCPSAAAAFHMIETFGPDLILLDYEMPVCTGAQFLQMIKSEPATEDIPVIFLTSKNDVGTVKEVLALNPQGYLLKTQTRDVIVGFVKDFFAKGKAE